MTSHDDRSFQDGWGPGAFDTDDWRAGDRDPLANAPIGSLPGERYPDHGQHEQRREHPQDNRPNLLRRLLDMGTPGEWASDFAATLALMALFVCMFVFAAVFS